jgi:hypothetical protein
VGFAPLQRHQLWRPGNLGVASPDTFRLQGFSPSCRLASSRTFRPCFMPVPLMGFTFRAFSPHRALSPPEPSDPRDVAQAVAPQASSKRSGPIPAYRALLSARIRHPPKRGEPLRRTAALLVFRPLRESPSQQPDARAPDPLRSFTSALMPESTMTRAALQGVDRREVG